MRMTDIIEKKRDGGELTRTEIEFFVDGYARGDIPDYQAAAWCMAVFFRGMTARETADLTLAMAHSGDILDLHDIAPIVVDKHSSGGVGDKVSLVVTPLVADNILKTDSAGFGLLSAAMGVGALIAAIGTAYARKITMRRMLISGALFSIFLGALAISTSFPLSMLLFVCTGVTGITCAGGGATWRVVYAWAPGGKAIMFTVTSAGIESYNDARIEVQTLATKKRKILIQGGFGARYSPSGHIVYANGGSLYAVPFDAQRLEVSGLPAKVVEGVAFGHR